MTQDKRTSKIRYAVVGLGHIAQVAVLPAFAHARRNSTVTALVSDDPEKLRQLSRRYRVKLSYSYEQYDDCLRSGNVDAVYIALPNNMHAEYSIRAANAGVHVLCEAPKAYGTGLSHRSQQWDDCGKVVGVLLCAGKRRGHRTPNSRYMMSLRDRCIRSTG
jgi:hypothetical protein